MPPRTSRLNLPPLLGLAQPAINWWYVGSLVDLWFTPIALATAYYLIPKIVGRPIYSEKLGAFRFLGSRALRRMDWMTHLIGGPLPAWMITASIVAKMLMLIPVLAVGSKFSSDHERRFRRVCAKIFALRFVVTGAVVYTAYSFVGSIISTRSIAQFTQFTFVTADPQSSSAYLASTA